MTRKKYIGKIQHLVLAVAAAEGSFYGNKIGGQLRYVRDHVRMAAQAHGSYAAAWDSDAIRWMRKHYGVD